MLGYNKMTGYNIARYNADGTELLAIESITPADVLEKNIQPRATESLVPSDTLIKNITAKILTEEVKPSIWIDIDRDPAQNDWGDQ